MYKIALLALTIAMTIGSVSSSSAGNSWKSKDHKNQNYARTDASPRASIEFRFTNYDRELVRSYYSYVKRKKVPPGLAKKNQLPPGLQKQVLRNGRLPPGLQGRYLPYELERRMAVLPRNYVRLRVGTDIVLMDIPTKIILDVIKDIGF